MKNNKKVKKDNFSEDPQKKKTINFILLNNFGYKCLHNKKKKTN